MPPCQDTYDAEIADAWRTYLDATRSQHGRRYLELEPWAWARLRQKLRAIQARQRYHAAKAATP